MTPDQGASEAARRSQRQTRTQGKRARPEFDDSDDTGRNRTRVRVTMACTECRKRKDRCDGRQPTCLPCSRAGRRCSYNPSKKRGLRPGYVRALETMLGLVFSTIDGSEAWLSSLLNGEEMFPEFSLIRQTAWAAGGVEALIESSRKSAVLRQTEQILASSETGDDQDEGEASGPFDRTALQALDTASRIINAQDSTEAGGVFPLSPMNTVSTPQPTTVSAPPIGMGVHVASAPEYPMQSAPTPVASLMLPYNWSQLLDLYFMNHHCWLPMSQKHDLLRCAHVLASHESGSSTIPEDISQGDLAFLSAVLTFVSPFVPSLDPSSTGVHCQPGSLLNNTLGFFPDDAETHDLGHVRALNILALMRIQENKPKAAWAAVGRAVYCLTSLVPSPFRSGKASVDDGFRRTTLCCIALDSLVASWLGIRPYFTKYDMENTGFLSTGGIEEWESWQPKGLLDGIAPPARQAPSHVLSTCNHLVELAGILNQLSWLRDSDETQFVRLSQTLREYIARLEALHPDTMSMPLPPQLLNVHFLSIAVQEALKARQIELTGTCSDFRDADPSGHLRRVGSMVHSHMALGPIYSALPLHNIYFHIIDLSLDCRMKFQRHLPSVHEELQTLRNSFAEMSRSRQQCADIPPAAGAQALPMVAEDMAFDPLMDVSIPNDMNEDCLFQSLADLDSADWSANPPDFMKHLGVLSDLPPDLAIVLFDEDGV